MAAPRWPLARSVMATWPRRGGHLPVGGAACPVGGWPLGRAAAAIRPRGGDHLAKGWWPVGRTTVATWPPSRPPKPPHQPIWPRPRRRWVPASASHRADARR